MKPKRSARLDIYAHGGEVITSKSRFMKSPDAFRQDTEKTNFKKVGKGGDLSRMSGETKTVPLPKRGQK